MKKTRMRLNMTLLILSLLVTSVLLAACNTAQAPEPGNGNNQPPVTKPGSDGEINNQSPAPEIGEYALIMLEEKANELQISNISDLAKNNVAGTMVVSAPEQAYKGDQILEAMQEEYGAYFKNHAIHEENGGYQVLTEGSGDAEVGVALVTADDPVLQKNDIRVLVDDKTFFKK